MKTLSSNFYNTYDDKVRKPCTKVTVCDATASIPFSGKTIGESDNDRKYPEQVIHSTGRRCVVYNQKYTPFYGTQALYYRATAVDQILWDEEVLLISGSHLQWDYDFPTLVELTNTDLGIVCIRQDQLWCITVNTAGVIQTALTQVTGAGVSANTCSLGKTVTGAVTTYWLFYEYSGIIYYRTSTDFLNWSAASDFNTITGLSNNHYAPSLHVNSTYKMWVSFERVTNAVVTPEVVNAYYITSTDKGSSWGSPEAMTTFSYGEGCARIPNMCDVSSDRYFTYLMERQLQKEQCTEGSMQHQFVHYNEDTNEVIYIYYPVAYAVATLVFFNLTTRAELKYLLTDYITLTDIVHNMQYDAIGQKIAISTKSNGLIIYNIISGVWKQYTTATLSGMLSDNVQAINIENNIVYFETKNTASPWSSRYILSLTTETLTVLSGTDALKANNYQKGNTVYITNSYVIFWLLDHYNNGILPYILVYRKSDVALLFEDTLANLIGTSYRITHADDMRNGYVTYGVNFEDDLLYVPAIGDIGAAPEYVQFGLLHLQFTDSAITISDFWNNSDSNPYGLLPNAETTLPNHNQWTKSGMYQLEYNSTTKRLYILGCRIYGQISVMEQHPHLQVINMNTSSAIETYLIQGSTEFAAHFPAIDAAAIKILYQGYAMLNSPIYWSICSTNNKQVIFNQYVNTYNGNVFILATENASNIVYYTKTDDDITWSVHNYFTREASARNIKMCYNQNSLSAIWHYYNSDRVYEIVWDQIVSGETNLSAYIPRVSVRLSDTTGANSATITFEDPGGRFNFLNKNSLWQNKLRENNIVQIQAGNDGFYTPIFTGYIAHGSSPSYSREGGYKYSIVVLDKSKNWFKRKITTELYENKRVDYIVEDIITTYGGLIVGEYDMPELTARIPTVQFIDEYIMDILYKVYQSYNYFPYFDEAGILRAKLINKEATVDYTFYKNGTDTVAANKAPEENIKSLAPAWDDNNIVNIVTVIGETATSSETTFAEEYIGTLSGTNGWQTKKNVIDFYFSNDKELKCVNPRLDPIENLGNKFFGGGQSISTVGSGKQDHCRITQRVSAGIIYLYCLIAAAAVCCVLAGFGVSFWGAVTVWTFNPLAAVVAAGIAVVGQLSNYYYDIYACPVGEPIPDIISQTVGDSTLISEYGEIPLEINNPFLDTEVKCLDLANFELTKAKWFRYPCEMEICSNLALQVHDMIRVYYSPLDLNYTLYIREITREYERGKEAIDVLRCAIIRS